MHGLAQTIFHYISADFRFQVDYAFFMHKSAGTGEDMGTVLLSDVSSGQKNRPHVCITFNSPAAHISTYPYQKCKCCCHSR